MKTLIVDIIEPGRLGELVTVSRSFCDKPDVVGIGKGEIPGTFGNAYVAEETVGANLVGALAELIRAEAYEIILMSATNMGNSLGGPLAAALSAGLVSEVIGLNSETEVTRPVYGGKAVATYCLKAKPAILTIRRKYFEKAVLEGKTQARPLKDVHTKVQLVAEHEEKPEGVPLEDAEIIVSGGRGLGNAEGFGMLHDFAVLLRQSAVGASRGAVDEGWVKPTLQIGQTGKIVAPSVYFSVGISGASQHLAGIANAKCVVAVNKDEEANIFSRARFGIVEDYRKVLPALIRAVKAES